MAAITGTGASSIFDCTSWRPTAWGAPPPNSLMSAPAMNVRPSQITTTADAPSSTARVMPSNSPWRTCQLSAFTGGLSTITRATSPPSAASAGTVSSRTDSLTDSLVMAPSQAVAALPPRFRRTPIRRPPARPPVARCCIRCQTPDATWRSGGDGVAGEVAVGMQRRLEAPHAGEPPVAVGGLALDVGGHLGMRQHQEALVADGLQAQRRHVGGLEHAVAAGHPALPVVV